MSTERAEENPPAFGLVEIAKSQSPPPPDKPLLTHRGNLQPDLTTTQNYRTINHNVDCSRETCMAQQEPPLTLLQLIFDLGAARILGEELSALCGNIGETTIYTFNYLCGAIKCQRKEQKRTHLLLAWLRLQSLNLHHHQTNPCWHIGEICSQTSKLPRTTEPSIIT